MKKTKRDIMFVMMYIAIGAALVTCVIMNSMNMEEQKKQINEMSKKLDTIASETDSKMMFHGVQLENMETNIKQIRDEINNQGEKSDEVEKSVKDLEKKIDTKVKDIEDEIEEVRVSKEQNKQEQLAASQKVMSATIIKNEHGGIMEIDDDDNPVVTPNPVPSWAHLTPESGIFWFGNQFETYYNLDMSVIVQVAHDNGIQGDYWVRSDGCKMLGDYIMLACNRDVHPYGSIVQTSLGAGISLDTGGFAAGNPYQVDIAVTW